MLLRADSQSQLPVLQHITIIFNVFITFIEDLQGLVYARNDVIIPLLTNPRTSCACVWVDSQTLFKKSHRILVHEHYERHEGYEKQEKGIFSR